MISSGYLLVDNYRLRNESVRLGTDKYADQIRIDVREGYGNHLPYQITFAFPITMINDGLRPATVVSYELAPVNCDYEYTFRGQDGDQGLFGRPNDAEPLILPFAIGPAEGKTVFLKTAVVVTDRTTDAALELPRTSTLRDLLLKVVAVEKGAGMHDGEDFFGNPIEYGIGVRGLMDFEFKEPNNIRQPVYKLVVQTARGGRYETVFGPYPLSRTKQIRTDCGSEPFDKAPTLQLKPD